MFAWMGPNIEYPQNIGTGSQQEVTILVNQRDTSGPSGL